MQNQPRRSSRNRTKTTFDSNEWISIIENESEDNTDTDEIGWDDIDDEKGKILLDDIMGKSLIDMLPDDSPIKQEDDFILNK